MRKMLQEMCPARLSLMAYLGSFTAFSTYTETEIDLTVAYSAV